MACARDVTRSRQSARYDRSTHLNVIFINFTVKFCAAAPSEHHGVENGQVGGFVEASDGDERRGLLVDAEHAVCVVDEGGGHVTFRAIDLEHGARGCDVNKS